MPRRSRSSKKRSRARSRQRAAPQQRAKQSHGRAANETEPSRFRRVRLLVLTGLVGLGSVPVGLRPGDIPTDNVVQIEVMGFASLAAVLAAFQVGNSLYRVRAGHFQESGLRRLAVSEFAIGGVAMAALAAAGMMIAPSPVVLGVMFAWAALLLLSYDMVERGLWSAIEANDDVEHCTTLFAKERLSFIGSGQSMRDWAVSGDKPYHKLVVALTDPGTNVSRTRSIVVAVMMWLCIGLLASTITLATDELVHGTPGSAPTEQQPNVLEETKAETSGTAQPSKIAPNAAPAKPINAECDTPPGVRTQDRPLVSVGERETLNGLYNGGGPNDADPPPGTAGGCTGPVQISSAGPGSRLVYLIGRDPADDDVVSVAFVSGQFAPGVVMAPAGEPVLRLIEMYGDIGGTRRVERDTGQLYGIETPYGTAVLIRHVLVRQDGLPQPYVTLVPAAVMAWRKAMAKKDRWLWPIESGSVNGKQRIRLVANLATGASVVTIFVDPSTRKVRYSNQTARGGPYGESNLKGNQLGAVP